MDRAAEYPDADTRAGFVMSFVSASKKYRQQYEDLWLETLNNFTVGSQSMGFQSGNVRLSNRAMDAIYLKDPETHKVIMTYAAKLVRSTLGDARGEYVQAQPVGWEDAAQAAPTVSRLMRYALRLPGHFRTMVESVIEMLLFGTGIVEVGWRYEEMELPIRAVMQGLAGTETPPSERRAVPTYDDVDLGVIDVQDFYPDPGEYRIERMKAAAKRFRTCISRMRQQAEAGRFDKAAIEKIAADGPASESANNADRFRVGVDQPQDAERLGDFEEIVGYEYWGERPWKPYSQPGVITVVAGEVVGERDWPFGDPYLPFKTLVINPTVGRFYGIAPAEVIRYDQDFADVLKELIARAIIRQVHPPIAFDPDGGDIDTAMLKMWHVDQPIPVRGGPNAIGTLRYDANLAGATNVLAATKQSMQEGTGATGGLQGEPGPSREAATAAAFRQTAAMDRPELAAMMLERESLPSIGLAILRRYQQFLEDEQALTRRIGELPAGMWLGDILAEFDIQFVGSRQAMTRQQKLQATQTLTQMAGAIPPLAAGIPWDGPAIARLVGDILELPELAAAMGNPATMALNVKLQQLMGGGAGAAPSPSSPEPAGLLPSQAAGAPLGG